jgi:hypothetical protein
MSMISSGCCQVVEARRKLMLVPASLGRLGGLNTKCDRAVDPFPGGEGLVAVCWLFSGVHVVPTAMKKVGDLIMNGYELL